MTLIIEPEVPERNDVAVGIFNVIFHDYASIYSLYLFLTLFSATYLKGVFTDYEIRFF